MTNIDLSNSDSKMSYDSESDLPIMMTVSEFGKFLRVSRTTAYSIVKSGKIPYVKAGRQIRIHRNNVLDFCKNLATTEIN